MKTILLLSLFFLLSTVNAQPLWMRYTSISPDGTQILFSYQADLYKVNAAGGLAIPLTTFQGRDYLPVWSPDGSQVAFASDRYGNYDVFIMNIDGSDLK